MQKLGKSHAVKDLLYNASAVIILNVVIQFVAYPYLNAQVGESDFGTILYLMAIVGVIANSIGAAVNHTRLVIKPQFESKNGDYNTLLLLLCGICLAAVAPVLYALGLLSAENVFFLWVLIAVTVLRTYSEVEYRLSLNYKRLFLYYILIAAGYAAGVLVYPFTKNWYFVFILGEGLPVLIMMLTRSEIYWHPFECSDERKRVWKMCLVLCLSYGISNFFLYIDRIILQNALGGDAVTVYYAASLLGKTVALLTGPLGGVIISYLARYGGKFTVGLFNKGVLLGVALSAVCFAGCVIVSPWLISLLYPETYQAASGLIVVASLGQIFYFTSTLLLMIVLRFCHEKYQFTTQLVYGIIYIALAVPAVIFYGIYGFAYASLTASLVRFAAVVLIGYKNSEKKQAPPNAAV